MNNVRTTPAPTDARGPARDGRRLVVEGIRGTGLALVLVAFAYMLHQAMGEALLVAGGGGTLTEVTFGHISGMTVLGGAIGVGVAYAATRWIPRPLATFAAVCVIGLAGYAVVPFSAAVTMSTAIWLNLFHVAVAVPIVGLLSRRVPLARS